MNKDLHDMDDLFRSALEGYEETPSSSAKEGLDAALDKKDAEKYKKRFIIWKRTALLLLLLLAGIVLFDSGLITKGSRNYTDTKSNSDKINTAENKNETGNNNKADNYSTNSIISNNQSARPDNDFPVAENHKDNSTTSENISAIDKETPASKNKQPGDIFNQLSAKQNRLFSIAPLQPNKKLNESVGTEIIQSGIEPLDRRTSIAIHNRQSPKKFSLLPLFVISNSPTKVRGENDIAVNKKNPFSPFWTITPFISYDQAGYRLDSDQPSAITSIKFREANEPSYSAGLLLTRQFTPRFGLQSGIVYRNTAIGMKPQKTYAFTDPTGDVAYKYITSSGYAFFKPGFGPQPAVGDSLTTAEGKHKLENISIPLMARYTVLNNKNISVTAGAGMEANFITKANLEVDIEDPFNREIVVIRKLNGTKSFYGSFIADAEIKYIISKKLSVNFRPVYRTAISPITKNNVVETFPRSFGIGAGVTIKF